MARQKLLTPQQRAELNAGVRTKVSSSNIDRRALVWWYAKTKALRPVLYLKGRIMGKHDDPVNHDEDISETLKDNFLLEDLAILLENINLQIREVEIEAEHLGLHPTELRTSGGDWPLRSLLSAKAHTLNAMVVMKTTENYARTINIYNNPPT